MSFLEELHKPDILDCISHLSSDEVFTPPKLVNEILDTLPQELFKSPNTKFLDPCCKSGVFLREIAKRLIDGLAETIPNLEERLEHIYKNQLFGLAITELTGLLSRRSVYCSKNADGEYSVCQFCNNQGNIEYKRTYHIWFKDKCMMCGASKSEYDRGEELETHAYSFIHSDEQRNSELFKRLKDMKFDVIIGNPPYQLTDGGSGNGISAKPLYHLFVQQAKKLNPRYITMIIPSRWFAGGKGLDNFRDEMLNDSKLKNLVDYPKSRDCFPGVDIAGGVCYFLWSANYNGDCEITSCTNGNKNVRKRKLNEFEIFIRDNIGIDIIHKILKNTNYTMNQKVYSRNVFGFVSSERGESIKRDDSVTLISSGGIGYVSKNDIQKNKELLDLYKISIGKVNPDRGGVNNASDGKMNVTTKIAIIPPNTIVTETYLILSVFKNEEEAKNCQQYFKTKLVRFLIAQTLSSMNITKENFCFVPIQDFNEEWTDEKLYKKYDLTQNEIDFIESMIRPME